MSQTDLFKKKFFKDVSLKDWRDWHWQLKNKISNLETLQKYLDLSEQEQIALKNTQAFSFGITPYYLSLLEHSALRKTMIPLPSEAIISKGESEDPLGENPCLVAPNLIHRYPDRVLFLVTDFCSCYCRYCTRARLVGKQKNIFGLKNNDYQKAFDYIASHKEIRDVLISGGDPLTLQDKQLEDLLSRLRQIPHVEMIRIGTKVPAVLPMRITKKLANLLKKYHPLYLSLHFTHPDELTKQCQKACEILADAGLPLGSQTVLLKDVNDSVKTLKSLMHGLLKIRVRPYYLFQCDPIKGSSHFRVPVKKGLFLIDALRGNTSGYAVPTYAIDIPEGGGKIILNENHVIGRDGDFLLLRNFEDKLFLYPDP